MTYEAFFFLSILSSILLLLSIQLIAQCISITSLLIPRPTTVFPSVIHTLFSTCTQNSNPECPLINHHHLYHSVDQLPFLYPSSIPPHSISSTAVSTTVIIRNTIIIRNTSKIITISTCSTIDTNTTMPLSTFRASLPSAPSLLLLSPFPSVP